ncbi:ASCH domain-containing protein [Clostridium algidicarnis]|uniref:ASCH domain-containing protein n=1 Tax=Clostridium algidicarnis TaxID=37659 RepID=UPI001C0E6A5E|nr:ASCH domain-containing protein [Clostridium algidicarnis]MBU3229043.1 ASCH domain-containing protein [Clostridium algidicarnis]MBU3252587.1 ASCH domain-containing protein [Clostridium algidicarnis]
MATNRWFEYYLDSDNNAVCITETIKVYTCPFGEVSERHAFKEGEGDCSISYWRIVHKDFFQMKSPHGIPCGDYLILLFVLIFLEYDI